MAALEYKARDEHGRSHRGQEAALSETELREALRARGLWLVECQPSARRTRSLLDRGIGLRELILFTYHLQTVVSSGIPLLVGLDDLAKQTRHRRFRVVIEDVSQAVSGGATLSQALDRHRRVFPQMYVQMVRAAEVSGQLPEVLERLVGVLEWQSDLRAQLRQLTIYPTIVLTALLGLVVLLLAFVIPRFEGILTGLQVELPWPTRVLVDASETFVSQWIPIVVAVVCAVGLVAGLLRIRAIRLRVDALLLRLPIFGPLRLGMISSQIAHFLGAFTRSGVPVGEALDLIGGITGNLRAKQALEKVRTRVLEGETLTEAFTASRLFPTLVLRMVSIGEESGSLPESLEKAETYYNKEIPRKVQRLIELTGPALTVLLAAILCFVVLAVLLPIYSMYSSF